MKTIISILSAAAIIMMSAACTKQAHTSLSGDSLPLKITVTGHVRYLVTDSDGKTEPEIVKKGTTVNIMYGIPDADGKIEFAHRTAETDINGFFEYQIGCPTGKTMTVKVNSSEMGYSYTKDKEDSFVECTGPDPFGIHIGGRYDPAGRRYRQAVVTDSRNGKV